MAKRKDQAFLDWVSLQRSCLDGSYSEWDGDKWRNIACHVRRASNGGTGFKPVFSAVPMTRRQHDLQHQQGELSVLMAYTDYRKLLSAYPGNGVLQAKAWFDEQARHYFDMWKKSVTSGEIL